MDSPAPTPLQLKQFVQTHGQLYLDGFISSSSLHRRQVGVMIGCLERAINEPDATEAFKRMLTIEANLLRKIIEESHALDKMVRATYEMATLEGKPHA